MIVMSIILCMLQRNKLKQVKILVIILYLHSVKRMTSINQVTLLKTVKLRNYCYLAFYFYNNIFIAIQNLLFLKILRLFVRVVLYDIQTSNISEIKD